MTTVKTMIKRLQKMVKDDPSVAELQVVTAADDEGNGYNPVYYSATQGWYEDNDFEPADKRINAVCLN